MLKQRAKGRARILCALSAATIGITCLSKPCWAQPGGSAGSGQYFWRGASPFSTAWSDGFNWRDFQGNITQPFYPNDQAASAFVEAAPVVSLDVNVILLDFLAHNSTISGTGGTKSIHTSFRT